MSSPPDIDPYAVLGVSKDATLSEIRAAHRKRVLKCHPDKIQDESQRNAAQDEFQRVQHAYELLSDETRRTRYDQKVKLAELKREVLERRRTESSYASPRGNPREMRNGRIVEERVPMDVFLDEAVRFADDLRSTARKADDFGKRAKAKSSEEKKKSRTPMSSYRASKDAREAAKATQADRAKQRDKDRRREASAKYEEVYEPYSARVESDDGASDSSGSIYVRLKKPSSHRRRESRSRPANISRRRDRIYDDEDDYSDRYSSKYDSLHTKAQEHIERSKYEGPRMSRSPPRARGYDSAEPEVSASRRPGRSSRSTRNQSSSRDNSYEHLDSPRVYRDDFKPPKMSSSSTSPGHKASIRPSLFSARTTTASGFTRKREGSSREVPTLEKMAREQVREPIPPHSSRRGDSGYSSPSTPEILPRGSSPKVTTRYKIDDTIFAEPSTKPKYRSISPERPRGPPKRASTMNYASEASPRIEVRTVRPSRPYGDVEWSPRFRSEDVKYAREIRPSDASMSPSRPSYYTTRHPPPSRRQSTWA